MSKMLIDARHPEETRVVVLKGNRIEEFDFESADKRQLKGNIYLAKVTRVEPSLQAAFVEYGGNRHGFLAFSEIHPDYYQIPHEDREALLREEHDHHAEVDERSDRRRRRGRRFDRKGRRNRQEERAEATGDTQDTEQSDAEAMAQDALPETEASALPLAEDAQPDVAGAELPPVTSEHDDSEDHHGDSLDEEDDSDHDDEENDDHHDEAEDKRDHEENDDDDDEDEEESRGESEDEEDSVTEAGASDEAAEESARRRRALLRRRYKIQEVIKRRQILLVQVVKEERGGKGAALTTYLSLAGRYCVLMPNTTHGGGISRKISSGGDRKRLKEIMEDMDLPKGMGCIIRTAGLKRSRTEIRRDFDYLTRLWDTIRENTLQSVAPAMIYEDSSLIKRAIRDIYNKDIDDILIDGEESYRAAKDYMRLLMPSHARRVQLYKDRTPLFQRFAVESQLESMYHPTVQLKSGGYIVINPTEALVSIDINSGRATREHNIEETALKTNCEAADEIARQLRLRDMAGLVVIDFIDMEERGNIRTVERRLKEALKNDRARIQIGRISSFGLMEMSRQRLRTGVLEASTHECSLCKGTGFVRSISSSALHALRGLEEEAARLRSAQINLHVPDEVAIYILNSKRTEVADIEDRYGLRIDVLPKAGLMAADFELERFGTGPSRPVKQIDPAPAEPEEPEDVADEVDDEEDEAEDRNDEAEVRDNEDQEDQREDRGGRRRRGRRNRRWGPRDQEDSGESADAAPAAEATDGEDDADDAAEAAGGDDKTESSEERERRRRRRGRRGGRRRRPDGTDAPAEVIAAAAADSGPVTQPEAGLPDAANGIEPDTAPVAVLPVAEVAQPEMAMADMAPQVLMEPAATMPPEGLVIDASDRDGESAGAPPARKGWWQRTFG